MLVKVFFEIYLIFLFPRWLLVLMDGCLYIYSELDTESPARGGSHRNKSITGRVTLIVQACQPGWEEVENLRMKSAWEEVPQLKSPCSTVNIK